eukprot:1055178-Prymnesium_polylepis.1
MVIDAGRSSPTAHIQRSYSWSTSSVLPCALQHHISHLHTGPLHCFLASTWAIRRVSIQWIKPEPSEHVPTCARRLGPVRVVCTQRLDSVVRGRRGCVEKSRCARTHSRRRPLAFAAVASLDPLLMYACANASPRAARRSHGAEKADLFSIDSSALIMASAPQSSAATRSASYSAPRLIDSWSIWASTRAAAPPTTRTSPRLASPPPSS